MDVTSAGVDLAKTVISVCAIARDGRACDRRDLKREAFSLWLSRLPAGCVVGLEACGCSHYWARRMLEIGLQPRIMTAEFVAPYRKSRAMKNDRNDAEAVALAARPRCGLYHGPCKQSECTTRPFTDLQSDSGFVRGTSQQMEQAELTKHPLCEQQHPP